MRYSDCYELQPGMVLARALYSETNELLLSRGYVLDEAIIGRIRHLGISPVCVEEEGTEAIVIDDIVPESIRHATDSGLKTIFDEVLRATKDRMEANLDSFWPSTKPVGFVLPLASVKRTVGALIEELLDNMSTEWSILPTGFIAGGYFRHGVDVAILALLIGIHFQFRIKDLKYLGLGALLHDIGKSLAPGLLEKKYCDLSPEELIAYGRHPDLGLHLLDDQPEGLYIERQCIHQHHEQPDGRGFPQGLMGSQTPPSPRSNPNSKEIFRMAEIVRVADAYMNLTTGCRLPKALDPEGAMAEILQGTPNAYNPHIVSALSQIVVRFPRGARVRILKNSSQRFIGYRGVVAEPNPSEPHKPRVVLIENRFGEGIKPIMVDFSPEKTMQICLEV